MEVFEYLYLNNLLLQQVKLAKVFIFFFCFTLGGSLVLYDCACYSDIFFVFYNYFSFFRFLFSFTLQLCISEQSEAESPYSYW